MDVRKPLKQKAIKLDPRGAWIQKVTIGFGMTLYSYWNTMIGGPCGFVWGWSHKESFDVMGSWTDEPCRRQGVRTRINEEIFREHPRIKTWGGTTTGGFAFMKARGYKFSEEAGQWILRHPKGKRWTRSSG